MLFQAVLIKGHIAYKDLEVFSKQTFISHLLVIMANH